MYADKKANNQFLHSLKATHWKVNLIFAYLKTQFTTFFAFQGYVLRVI